MGVGSPPHWEGEMVTRAARARKPSTQAKAGPIDRDKLAAEIEHLHDDDVVDLFHAALAVLSDAQVVELIGHRIDVDRLRPDVPGVGGMRELLVDVRAFDAACRRGSYYEGFNVNSRNYMEKSQGTRNFIAECKLLFRRCVTIGPTGDPGEACEAFELLFDLLRRIDDGGDDIIFLADEAGSWQVGVDWDEVIPAWSACLSQTVEPEEYARRLVSVVDEFEDFSRDKHLTAAKKVGSAAHREAIAARLRDVGGGR